MDDLSFKEAFEELARGGIAAETVRGVFDAILRGKWTPVQVGAFVAALRIRGESAAVIEAAARALRAAMVPVEHGLARVLDTCGTGGDGLGTLNLSTGAAVVAAAAGVPVAKHGNRAASSKAGSADVLAALGIPIDLPPEAASDLLNEVSIAFMLAPTHHPAMRFAAEARRDLGVRTIFNCLGPLANPASATHQLVGAFDDGVRPAMAATLLALGTVRAWVVRGVDGLDEVSPCGMTRVTEVDEGRIQEREIHPEDFGLVPCALEAIAGGSATENAKALELILSGERHPARMAVVLNAAAALVVFDALEPRQAAEKTEEAIASGAARQKLDAWRAAAVRRRG